MRVYVSREACMLSWGSPLSVNQAVCLCSECPVHHSLWYDVLINLSSESQDPCGAFLKLEQRVRPKNPFARQKCKDMQLS